MDKVDACVIGAGVIGLAVGRALARKGLEVLVLEAGARIGEGVSSRNSEVIHAGIYYPTGSLKAELCVRGKHLLYEYCEQHHVSCARIGKLIVATSAEDEAQLSLLEQQATTNGVHDLEWIPAGRLQSLEPAVQGVAALLSPSTGIVSAHELMLALQGDLEAKGGTVALSARVTGIEWTGGEFRVLSDIGSDSFRFSTTRLVNAAGLGAQFVAALLDAGSLEIPPLYYCKGNYFTWQGRSPFSRLIYPVPEAGGAGLGVHATLDLGGQLKFGPDVEYVETEDYEVSAGRIEAQIAAIRRYFPALDASRLAPGYAGIRPKLQGPGAAPADFMIQGPESHQIAGLVNLFGIESPGLTSSLAIAETVVDRLHA